MSFSVMTKVRLLRKIWHQWGTLSLISALFLIMWGGLLTPLGCMVSSRDAWPLMNRTATSVGEKKKKKERKRVILTKCLANSVRSGSCSYVEILDKCKFLRHGLTLQCLQVCTESSTILALLLISTVFAGHSAHIPGSQCDCAQHIGVKPLLLAVIIVCMLHVTYTHSLVQEK